MKHHFLRCDSTSVLNCAALQCTVCDTNVYPGRLTKANNNKLCANIVEMFAHICILLCAHTCRQWTRGDVYKPVVRELSLASATGVKTFICARTLLINQAKYGLDE